MMSHPKSAAIYFDDAWFYSPLKSFRMPKYITVYDGYRYLYPF